MILIFSLLLYFLSLSKKGYLWLALPVSLFWDLWRLKPLGLSGLEIILGLFFLRFSFTSKVPAKDKYRLE